MAKNPGINLEEQVAKDLLPLFQTAQRTKASGSVWNSGDVTAGPLEIEAKDRPQQKSVSISQTTIRKIRKSALKSGRVPLIVTRNLEGTFVTLNWLDFLNFLRETQNLYQILYGEDQENLT